MTAATVLVVDDDHLVRWALSERLSAAGYRVLQAGSAREALELCGVARLPPELVLLDLRLPDSRDLQLFDVLHARHPSTPVIVLTADDSPAIAKQAMAAGAYVVRLKPFDLDEVESLVASALAKH